MKKGFIHMVEIVLVSLVTIISLPVLLYPWSETSKWPDTLLYMKGDDVIASLDELNDSNGSFLQNIMGKNESEIKYEIQKFLGGSQYNLVSYGIYSDGAIKNRIRVGFNCTTAGCNQSMINYLRNVLTPCYVNGRYVSFDIIPFSYGKLDKYDIDVIFVNDTAQVDRIDKNIDEVKRFLSEGGGIILFINSKNLTIDWNANRDVYSDIFGLSNPGGSGGSGYLSFTNPNDPTKKNYEIQKYFYGVGAYVEIDPVTNIGTLRIWDEDHDVEMNPGCTSVNVDTNITTPGYEENNLKEGNTFTMNFDNKEFNFSVEKIDKNCKYVIFNFLRKPTLFEFNDFTTAQKINPADGDLNRVVLETSGDKCALIINNTAAGRVAWVHDGNGNDVYALLKSSIIWASGSGWWNVLRTITGEQVKVSYFVSSGEEFHEPYWVEMTLWYVY